MNYSTNYVADPERLKKLKARRNMVTCCGQKISAQRLFFFLLLLLTGYTVFYLGSVPCTGPTLQMVQNDDNHYIQNEVSNTTIYYDRNMPLIFIGGMPRSGTTLMRVLLDTHKDVRCGEETRVIPRILGLRSHWERSTLEKLRLTEAGITEQVLDDAVMSFILEIIAKHGHAAPRLCNKDPFTLKSSIYLGRLFPEAKFVLMIRDGRAVVNSIITRKVSISGFDLTNFRSCMKKWNLAIEVMYDQCMQVGANRCMPVYYEQLVLHPEVWLKKILKFLSLEWDDAVLHHEDFVGTSNGAKLSKTEKSTDQVIKPINIAALTSWVDNIPDDIRRDMPNLAPMLDRLGYDPRAYPPEYGKPDSKVLDNTKHINKDQEYWQQRDAEIDQQKNEAIRQAKMEAQRNGIVMQQQRPGMRPGMGQRPGMGNVAPGPRRRIR